MHAVKKKKVLGEEAEAMKNVLEASIKEVEQRTGDDFLRQICRTLII